MKVDTGTHHRRRHQQRSAELDQERQVARRRNASNPQRQAVAPGLKLHIGVDTSTGLAHSAVVMAPNVHDKPAIAQLLHGAELKVYGDSAYASHQEQIACQAPQARDGTNRRLSAAGYKGLAKNATRAFVARGLANIYMARKHLVE